MRVLFSDALHFNEKNFSSLLEYLRQVDAKITRPANAASITLFGKYQQFPSIAERASVMGQTALRYPDCCHRGINLFDLARAELMSLCCSRAHWLTQADYGATADELFDRLLQSDREDLVLNLAAAHYWIDYWYDILNGKTFEFVFVFSGSLIYAAALIAVMKNFPGRVFVFEHFFSGRHFYCEEKYSHLANNSDARRRNVLHSSVPHGARINQERLERGIRALQQIKNKNVTQPQSQQSRLFANRQPTVLIAGQVLNDFSLLATGATGIHSLAVYKQLIREILARTEANIIFKAHPWENHKSNLQAPVTLRAIQQAFGACDRVKIVEQYALSDALAEADHVVLINSQLGIEAALAGLKPYQLGQAFYGAYGFTFDLRLDDFGPLLERINSGKKSLLSSSEYLELRSYLMHMLVDHLVPEDPAQGLPRLKRLFNISPRPAAARAQALERVAPASAVPTRTQRGRLWAKYKKLRRHPKNFCADSRYSLLNAIARVL